VPGKRRWRSTDVAQRRAVGDVGRLNQEITGEVWVTLMETSPFARVVRASPVGVKVAGASCWSPARGECPRGAVGEVPGTRRWAFTVCRLSACRSDVGRVGPGMTGGLGHIDGDGRRRRRVVMRLRL